MAKHLKNPTPQHIKDLIDSGYRRVSRRHGMIARIDREDWMDHLAGELHTTVDKIRSSPQVYADLYRRLYSKDVVTMHPTTALRIPPSGGDRTGFVPVVCNRLHMAAA